MAAAALATTGCRSTGELSGAGSGAILGGLAGAGIGRAVGHHNGNEARGGWAGAALGAVVGGLAGALDDERSRDRTVPYHGVAGYRYGGEVEYEVVDDLPPIPETRVRVVRRTRVHRVRTVCPPPVVLRRVYVIDD
jgi:hypothetical protein